MSAIGNAEAVVPADRPAGTGSAHFAGTVAGVGAGEAQRRLLTEAEADAIVRQEAAEREAAAGEYERGGRAAEAARLREGARALMAVRAREPGGAGSAVICRATDSGSAHPTIHSW